MLFMMYFAYKSVPLSFGDKCKALFTKKKKQYKFELVSIKSDTKHCIFGYHISKDNGLERDWTYNVYDDWVFVPLSSKSVKEYYQQHKGEHMSQLTFVKEALNLPSEISSEEELIVHIEELSLKS